MIRAQSFTDKWPVTNLGQAVEFLDHLRKPVKASERVEGDYYYYGANGIQGTINDFIFDEPLVLLAEDGGHFGNPDRTIAYIAEGKYWVNNHAHVLKPKDGMDLNYLCRVLEKYDVTPFIKGATRAKLSKTDASRIPIPLPPLPIQKQIAALLEKADTLRSQCKQMEQELNRLAQSVFLEMFGDPVTNPKGWDVSEVSQCAHVKTGNTPSKAIPEYYSEKCIEWIKSDNINTPDDYLTKAKDYLSEKGKSAGRVVGKGSVLVTCIAGSHSCIGNASIADRDVAYNQQINALIPTEAVTTEYLYMLCIVGKKIIQQASTNAMKGMVSKGVFEKIKLPIAPIELQRHYSSIFHKINEKKKAASISNENACDFFDSLMQNAFSGKLNLTKAA
ncbi:MAG: restriction endonuclease subunit S [Candidatus Thiodiazotropha taylori]